jgi:hypothetical protein
MGWVFNAPVALPPGKRAGTHFIRGWVTPSSVGRVRKTHYFYFKGIMVVTVVVVEEWFI